MLFSPSTREPVLTVGQLFCAAVGAAQNHASRPLKREFPLAYRLTQSAFANQQAAGRQKRKEPKCRRIHAAHSLHRTASLQFTGIFPVKRVYSAVYKHILNYMHKWGFRQVFCT